MQRHSETVNSHGERTIIPEWRCIMSKKINLEVIDQMFADVKRTAEKLEKAFPNSESIKRGFRLAFLQG